MKSVAWTADQLADCFRREIHSRFDAENAAHRSLEEAELAKLVAERGPAVLKTSVLEARDSFLWEIYAGCEIAIDNHVARVLLPENFAIGTDVIGMFDDTEPAWFPACVRAKIVDGVARLIVEITFIDYWDDARSTKWRAEAGARPARWRDAVAKWRF